MSKLSRLYIRAGRSIKSTKLQVKLARSLLKSTDLVSKEIFGDLKTGVVVQVREGSVVSIIELETGADLFFQYIRKYSDFRNGLLMLLENARKLNERIRSIIVKQGTLKNKEIQLTRGTRGLPMQLYRLGRNVAEQIMSDEDALKKAIRIFEGAGEKVLKKHYDALRKFFKGIPLERKKVVKASIKAPSTKVDRPWRRRAQRKGVELRRTLGTKEILFRHLP